MSNWREKLNVEFGLLWVPLMCIIGISIPIIMFPQKAEAFINKLLSIITYQVGWAYLWFFFGLLVFTLWLSFSKYGNVKLGDGEPEFSTLDWLAMLFFASLGSSLLYWGLLEWAYYYKTPPFGLEPLSTMAGEWAATYGLFHWGITGWLSYVFAGVIVAYYQFVRKAPVTRISTICRGLLGKCAEGIIGKIIDVFVIVGLMAAVGTSLGLGTPMVVQGICRLFGLQPSFSLNVVVVLIWASIFGTSVYLGLEKGIKNLSIINLYLCIALYSYILIVGPTSFILNTFTNSIGLMLQNYIRMSFYTDPIAKTGFPQDWTVFYWAWWIVYVPLMGIFIGRISKGRTIKEVTLAGTISGALGAALCFAITTNYALYLQESKKLDVVGLLSSQGGPATIISILETLPLSKAVIVVFVLLAFIFLATSYDSICYSLASMTTKKLKVRQEPPRCLRVLWAFGITILPIILMFIGGLKPLQISSVIGSLPLMVIFAIMILSFFKDLKEDYKGD